MDGRLTFGGVVLDGYVYVDRNPSVRAVILAFILGSSFETASRIS